MRKNTLTAILGALVLIGAMPAARAEIASKEYVDEMDTKTLYGDNPEETKAGMVRMLIDAVREQGSEMSEAEARQAIETYYEGQMGAMGMGFMAMVMGQETMNNMQQKLGGTNDAGKVVTATGTPGRVTYTAIDSAPTANSTNLVTSDGVATAIANAAGNIDEYESKALRFDNQATYSIAVTDAYGNIGFAKKLPLVQLVLPTQPSECQQQGCILMAFGNRYVWEPVGRDADETISRTGEIHSYRSYDRSSAAKSVGGDDNDFGAYMEEAEE